MLSSVQKKYASGARLFLPSYKPAYFNTSKEFDAYIENPAYKNKVNGEILKGVCMGMEDFEDPS